MPLEVDKLTVKQLRGLAGITQEDLAKRYGVRNGQYVSSYLDKKTLEQLKAPYLKKLQRIEALEKILTEKLEK